MGKRPNKQYTRMKLKIGLKPISTAQVSEACLRLTSFCLEMALLDLMAADPVGDDTVVLTGEGEGRSGRGGDAAAK